MKDDVFFLHHSAFHLTLIKIVFVQVWINRTCTEANKEVLKISVTWCDCDDDYDQFLRLYGNA